MLLIHAYRHPAIANPRQLCYGRYDMPLASDWLQQLTPNGDLPRQSAADTCVFSSPSTRAQTYALRLWPEATVCLEPALLEMDFGEWEGRPWQEISRLEVDHWQRDLWRHSAPGGESAQAMRARIDGFLARLTEWAASSARLECGIVTHHGVLKLMVGRARKLAIEDTLAITVPFGHKLTFVLADKGLDVMTVKT